MRVALLVLAACTAPSTRQETTEDLTRILAGSQRSEEDRARDLYRHPKQTLLFFGTRPEMSVLEVFRPEPGWYTEILAPLLRDKGKYYAAVIAADPGSTYNTRRLAAYREKLAAQPSSTTGCRSCSTAHRRCGCGAARLAGHGGDLQEPPQLDGSRYTPRR